MSWECWESSLSFRWNVQPSAIPSLSSLYIVLNYCSELLVFLLTRIQSLFKHEVAMSRICAKLLNRYSSWHRNAPFLW